jgi:hypothetical protein
MGFALLRELDTATSGQPAGHRPAVQMQKVVVWVSS